MKTCDHCGKDIPASANYCRHCGQKLKAIENSNVNRLEDEAEILHSRKSKPIIDTPRPWLRFWARYIDISLFSVLSGVILSFFQMKSGPFFGLSFQGLLEIIILTMLFETACIAWIGTTPGKWIVNIKIEKWDGTKPSFVQAASRTFQVWARGMWFGLPLLLVIPMLMAKSSLVKTGSTSWDVFCATRVTQRPVHALRYIVMVFAVLSIMLVNGYFQTLANQETGKQKPKGKVSIEYKVSYNRGSLSIL